jgi:alkanesulfonate monooxygenase SsuD/methylene tetrahydromethanopterin reductase-like flavin-dependent oxidoreductase (luciferase family)
MTHLRFGIALSAQQTDWATFEFTARSIDQLGYDTLLADDHLYADLGAKEQPKLEAWTTIAALAPVTARVKLGHFVLANTFRNPGLVVKSAITLDHISNGRAILGIGAAWFEAEHLAFGIDFGSGFGQRLDWLDEAAGLMRALLDGQTVSHDGPHYHTHELRMNPLPVQRRLPILVGGAGEKKTLRTVARYADIWHTYTHPLDDMRRKVDALEAHCAAAGRDPSTIERSLTPAMITIRDDPEEARRAQAAVLAFNQADVDANLTRRDPFFGPPELIAERLRPYVDLGFSHIVADMYPPYDHETIERLIGEVGPLLEG